MCIFYLLSTTGTPISAFWQVQVRYTIPQFQRIRGRAHTFSLQFLLTRTSLSVPLSPCFLALAFPLFLSLILLPSCAPQTTPWTVSLLGFLLYTYQVYPSTLSRLRYPILFQPPLSLLSPMQSYQPWLATFFLACSLLQIAISIFSRLYSDLNTVFLVVLEHPTGSTLLAAVICTVSS